MAKKEDPNWGCSGLFVFVMGGMKTSLEGAVMKNYLMIFTCINAKCLPKDDNIVKKMKNYSIFPFFQLPLIKNNNERIAQMMLLKSIDHHNESYGYSCKDGISR